MAAEGVVGDDEGADLLESIKVGTSLFFCLSLPHSFQYMNWLIGTTTNATVVCLSNDFF